MSRVQLLIIGAAATAVVATGTAFAVISLTGGKATPIQSSAANPPWLIQLPAATSASPPPPRTGGAAPRTLVYSVLARKATEVFSMDIASGQSKLLARIPSQSVSAAPGGHLVAYLANQPSSNGTSNSTGPPKAAEIRVRNLETGADTSIGVGSGPVWSWNGKRLAALSSDLRVEVMDPSHPRLTPVGPPGQYTILGWAGDRVVVFKIPPLRLYFLGGNGALVPAPTPAAVLRAPSPDGHWLFGTSHQGGNAVFTPLAGGVPTVIQTAPWQLGTSYWTTDDRVFAAAATSTKLSAPSAVLEFDPSTRTVLKVPHTQGAVATIPMPSGGGFVLVKGKRVVWRIFACRSDGACRYSGKIQLGATLLQAR